MNPVTVTITRPHDPLEGLSLAVLGRVHRHGRLELLVALLDRRVREPPAFDHYSGAPVIGQPRVAFSVPDGTI